MMTQQIGIPGRGWHLRNHSVLPRASGAHRPGSHQTMGRIDGIDGRRFWNGSPTNRRLRSQWNRPANQSARRLSHNPTDHETEWTGRARSTQASRDNWTGQMGHHEEQQWAQQFERRVTLGGIIDRRALTQTEYCSEFATLQRPQYCRILYQQSTMHRMSRRQCSTVFCWP